MGPTRHLVGGLLVLCSGHAGSGSASRRPIPEPGAQDPVTDALAAVPIVATSAVPSDTPRSPSWPSRPAGWSTHGSNGASPLPSARPRWLANAASILPRGRQVRHPGYGPGPLRQHCGDANHRRGVHLGLARGPGPPESPGGLAELLGRPDHRQRRARAAGQRWDQRLARVDPIWSSTSTATSTSAPRRADRTDRATGTTGATGVAGTTGPTGATERRDWRDRPGRRARRV